MPIRVTFEGMLRLNLALVLLLASAGAHAEGIALRDDARAILKTRCGSCHDGDLATAKPAALAIYDLSKSTWADGLSAARLESMRRRIERSPASADDRARFAAFVEAELASKAAQ